jgi:hypothetical protein
MDQLTVKKAPAPPGVAVSQTARFGLLGQAMLRNQQNALELFGARPLNLRESAMALGIAMTTLRIWIKKGHVQAIRIGPLGHFRIRPEEIRRVLTQGVCHD